MQQKVVVVSDSHGNAALLKSIIARELPFDVLVHCGDGVDDLARVDLPPDVGLVAVAGNMDSGQQFVTSRIAFDTLNEKKIMVTHGDRFRVAHDPELLLYEAKKNSADIAFFGHTHSKYHSTDSPILFNPGPANRGVYGVVTINDIIACCHKKLG